MAEEIGPPREERGRGPRVWRDMDQAALDAAYDQGNYAPNMRRILERCASASAGVRARLGPPQCHAYGSAPIETIRLYPARGPRAPIHVFLHGGGWSRGTAEANTFPAGLFVRAGAHFAVPDFDRVQDAGGSLTPLAGQVRRAVAWIYRNADRLGCDADRIFVSGFSSGAHLAGVVLTGDWEGDFSLPPDIVKGGLLCSGMFDLEPVRLSARNRYIHFTDAMVEALSPQRHIDLLNAPVVVAYGTCESPEFQRQSREFAEAVRAAGKPVRLLVGEGRNHFEMLETLADPPGLLGRAALEQMGLTGDESG